MSIVNMENKTYFGLTIHNDEYVLKSDIEKLPFYKFWQKSSIGSTMLVLENDTGIYIHDWVSFSKRFIKSGTHRYLK